MEPERWRRVEELYHAALEVATEKRAGFLKDTCGDDERTSPRSGIAADA